MTERKMKQQSASSAMDGRTGRNSRSKTIAKEKRNGKS